MLDAPETLTALLDSTSPLERHTLLQEIERGARPDPGLWVRAIQQLRATRSIDSAVDRYLLHLITSDHVLDLTADDGEQDRRSRALDALIARQVAQLEGEMTDEEVDRDVEATSADFNQRRLEADATRRRMSERYHGIEQEVLRSLGEHQYARELADLPGLLARCRDGRSTLLGATWPFGYVEVLRLTVEQPHRWAYRNPNAANPNAHHASPLEALRALLDPTAIVDRRKLAGDIAEAGTGDPAPWLRALSMLRAEAGLAPEVECLLIDLITTDYLLDLAEADSEERRIQLQLHVLAGLYRSDFDAVWYPNEALNDRLPAEVAALREHLIKRTNAFEHAVLSEMGEREFANRKQGDVETHYEKYKRGVEMVFGEN